MRPLTFSACDEANRSEEEPHEKHEKHEEHSSSGRPVVLPSVIYDSDSASEYYPSDTEVATMQIKHNEQKKRQEHNEHTEPSSTQA